jgi:hypothetical protein
MAKVNPFKPGKIVHPGMFAGRVPDIIKLETVLRQTKSHNSEHFLINGIRGIGKSSLLLYLGAIAKGEIPPVSDPSPLKFLTVTVDLQDDNTYAAILRSIGRELKASVEKAEPLKVYAKQTWDFLKKWEIGGVRYRSQDGGNVEGDQMLLEALVEHVQKVANESGYDGVLLLLDEADKPPAEAHLGRFAKLFVDKLSRQRCDNVCLGLAGLPNLVDQLRQSHASSVRIFEPMQLLPLNEEDSKRAVKLGMDEANKQSSEPITITEEALDRIADWSDGFPGTIQEFAYCAFDTDTDNCIDDGDVDLSATRKGGAYERLGEKYFKELYFGQVKSDSYRQILRLMSSSGTHWVKKDSIRQGTGLKESVLTNGISALLSRHIIEPRPGVKGEYRLPSKALSTWIREFADLPGPSS